MGFKEPVRLETVFSEKAERVRFKPFMVFYAVMCFSFSGVFVGV